MRNSPRPLYPCHRLRRERVQGKSSKWRSANWRRPLQPKPHQRCHTNPRPPLSTINTQVLPPGISACGMATAAVQQLQTPKFWPGLFACEWVQTRRRGLLRKHAHSPPPPPPPKPPPASRQGVARVAQATNISDPKDPRCLPQCVGASSAMEDLFQSKTLCLPTVLPAAIETFGNFLETSGNVLKRLGNLSKRLKSSGKHLETFENLLEPFGNVCGQGRVATFTPESEVQQ